jgi:branched-subunit amino acid transport protein|tara:strand:+ start:77 stop:403 length:327 start_codon:yes stop_codon:yes gene_type:complete
MAINIVLAILVTSLATYLSRFLGAVTSEKISEKSKIYRWFNCIAYSTLAALISRMLIFPSGDLSEVNYISRIIVILLSILIFYVTKRNLVYPTVLSAIILAALSSFAV